MGLEKARFAYLAVLKRALNVNELGETALYYLPLKLSVVFESLELA
jgi:hypothetical protein